MRALESQWHRTSTIETFAVRASVRYVEPRSLSGIGSVPTGVVPGSSVVDQRTG
jgi:hypothetical protein